MLNDDPDWLQDLTTSQINGLENIIAGDDQLPRTSVPAKEPEYRDLVISEKPLKRVLVDLSLRKVNITHVLQAEGYSRARRDALLRKHKITYETRNGGRKTGKWIDAGKAIELCDDLDIPSHHLRAVFDGEASGDQAFAGAGTPRREEIEPTATEPTVAPIDVKVRLTTTGFQANLTEILKIAGYSTHTKRVSFVTKHRVVYELDDGSKWVDRAQALRVCEILAEVLPSEFLPRLKRYLDGFEA
jgi:hypothetical protein